MTLAIMLAFLLLLLPESKKKGLEMVMLDVGQGDGIAIHLPDGKNLLVDGGSLDVEDLAQLMEEANGMSVTLHRAFDVCRDPMEALEQVISLGFNTILTSGQKNNCVDGSPLLAELVEKSAGRIHIMAGAGVNADVIAPIYEKTGITDYHMTLKHLLECEMKYRKEGVSMGLPSLSEYEIFRTSEAEGKKAREVLARL